MESIRRRAVRIRPKARSSVPARLAVFTSVDGTLLDARTFEAGPSGTVVRRLLAGGVPVIPVSVMTLDEIAPLATELGLRTAMIIEAGGAIARWSGRGWSVEPCGPPPEALLDIVLEIERRSGANLLMFSALSESDRIRISGRTGPMLAASARRYFSEPFIIETGSVERVQRVAGELGYSVRSGRRFLHLCRAFDEGEAFTRLRQELGCETAIAIGGTAVDAEFMTRAEIPIIVPNADGMPDRELLLRVPDASIAPGPGPIGWAAAVEAAVDDLLATSENARAAAQPA